MPGANCPLGELVVCFSNWASFRKKIFYDAVSPEITQAKNEGRFTFFLREFRIHEIL